MVKKRGYKKRGRGVQTRMVYKRRKRIGVTVPLRVGGKHYFKRTGNLLTTTYAAVAVGPAGQGPAVSLNPTEDGMYLVTGVNAVSNSTFYSFAYQFDLGCLPDYTDFTNLFDQYKICGVRLKWNMFNTNSTTTSASNQNIAGIIHSIVDYDDASVMTASAVGIQAMREFESYRSQNLFDARKGSAFKRYVKPHIALAAYGGTVFTSYANKGPTWLDTATGSDIKHYGVKVIVELIAPLNNQNSYIWIKPEATLYIACKNVR